MKRMLALGLMMLILLCGCVGGTATTTTTAGDITIRHDRLTTTEGSTVTTVTSGSETGVTDGTTTAAAVAPTTERPVFTTTIKKTTTTVATAATTATQPPQSSVSEFRGAWVSYLELNGLLKSCTTVAQGQAAIDGLMDRMAEARMTAVFFHVRANSDAYYHSALFRNATAANTVMQAGFDPLAYAVEAAHRRGMELHAWVNPYRVGMDAAFIVDGLQTFQDGAKRYYYIPTDPAAQRLILDGIRELLAYDIDGIQYDDYFYPTGLLSENTVADFEKEAYTAYTAGGGKLSVGDWRRAGVDALVSGTHTLTAAAGVLFGVSPSHDDAKTYSQMFADTKKWLAQSGYVDYLCPQLYFGFDHSTAAFDTLTDRWLGYERHPSVSLYVGLGMHKIGLKEDQWAGNGKTEWVEHDDILKRQVQYLRQKGITGIGFYSSSLFDPDTCTVVSFGTANDLAVAKREIQQLLSVL